MYKGQRCYLRHLHYSVDFLIIYFINYIHALYCAFDDPFF
jgi:hypothetical protein